MSTKARVAEDTQRDIMNKEGRHSWSREHKKEKICEDITDVNQMADLQISSLITIQDDINTEPIIPGGISTIISYLYKSF